MRQAKFHYGWVVLAVTFLVLLLGAGIRATPSVLIIPLEKEFGWSAATIGGAVAINLVLYGLIGPFAVAVMERFGLRRSVCGALLLLAVGVALTTMMRTSWQLMLLWGVVVGSGTGMIALVLGATVASRWFVRHRGLAMGILTASSATGQLVFLPAMAALATHEGWRSVSLAAAAAAVAMVPFAAWLLRDRPSDMGLAPYGANDLVPSAQNGQNPAARALSALRDGSRSRDFWLLAGSFFICGASTNGLIGTHLIPACSDHGIPEVTAASLLALMGIFDFFGTTGSGWLSDRYDSRMLLAWYYGLRGLSLLFLPYAFDISVYGLPIFAVFYGLDWIATVPPTLKLAGRSFGDANAAVMFAWIAAFHQIGAAFAAWMAGLIRTGTGDYAGAFTAAGLLCVAAAMMVTFIGTNASRHRRVCVTPLEAAAVENRATGSP